MSWSGKRDSNSRSNRQQLHQDPQSLVAAQGKRVAVILSYINCKNKDAVIGVLRKFLISQSTAVGQALSYYALTQLELLTVKSDKEFSVGLVKEFANIPTIKSEHSIRQALWLLRKEQYVTVNQKMCSGRLLDSDEIAPVLRRLKEDIKAVLTANQQQ